MSEDKALEKAAETLAKVEGEKAVTSAPKRSLVRLLVEGIQRFFRVLSRTGDRK